jgi:hypothetical protein
MFTRQEYMSAPSSAEAYRRFYGQFVTPQIKNEVLKHIGLDRLRASTNPHMNDIPLGLWGTFFITAPPSLWRAMRDAGDVCAKSLGNCVCVYKEAARQILEENTP